MFGLTQFQVGTVLSWGDSSAVPATLTAYPHIKMRLLYGLLNNGEQILAQIHMHQSSQHQAVDSCVNVFMHFMTSQAYWDVKI